MRDSGQRDQQAVLHRLRAAYPSRLLVIIGHSSGGHLSGLAPLTTDADALILVASGCCDWRDYPLAQWPRLLAEWWLVAPVLLRLWGYLPAWAGVGHVDDQGFAPPGAVRALLRRFDGARIEHREIAAAEGAQGRIVHFGFFKSQNAALWPYVSQWLDNISSHPGPRNQDSRTGADNQQK